MWGSLRGCDGDVMDVGELKRRDGEREKWYNLFCVIFAFKRRE
jgi:hypothetical protein